MIGLLISMFAGILVVANLSGVVPRGGETMLFQLAHLHFGNGPAYLCIQLATAAVLLMAANTSLNDFPRVLFLMARDQQVPRSFLHIGDRLTFSTGILLLSVASATIYVVLHGNTAALLPLYAVGVFLAFTLSQAGMVVHWRRHHDQPHWRRSLFLNATGAVLSGIVFVIAAVTKFTSDAWIAIVLIELIVLIALRTRRYYEITKQDLCLIPGEFHDRAPRALLVAPRPPRLRFAGQGAPAENPRDSMAESAEHPDQIDALTIIPVFALDRPTLRALSYAASLGQPLFALRVSPTTEEAERFRHYWQIWGDHLPLQVMCRHIAPSWRLWSTTSGLFAASPPDRGPALVALRSSRANRHPAAPRLASSARGDRHQRAVPPDTVRPVPVGPRASSQKDRLAGCHTEMSSGVNNGDGLPSVFVNRSGGRRRRPSPSATVPNHRSLNLSCALGWPTVMWSVRVSIGDR